MPRRVKRGKGFEITIDDTGLERLLELARDAPDIRVGALGAKGSAAHGDGETNASILAKHELGVGVPRRSWLRDWIAEKREWIGNRWTAALIRAVDRSDLRAQYDRLGLEWVGSIQQRIANRIPPPNSEVTIAIKGSDVPLIDSGQARTSITHEVD